MSNSDSATVENPDVKRHAACDECRKRKLKCSGEKASCSRCLKQGLTCHYSIQKQMGRPPKKRMREADDIGLSAFDTLYNISDLEREWTSADLGADTYHLCPPVYLNRPTGQVNPDSTASQESCARLRPISPTATPWPDFSTTSAASAMLSMSPGFPGVPSETIASGIPQGSPQCPCLSYLYLCLSTLSSLSAFSITRETLTSLHTAARTAQSVLRCEICPLSFATGMQNVMMLGTLLSVLADAWFKVSHANVEPLGEEIASPVFQSSIPEDRQAAKEIWKQWLRQIIRRSVIGGSINLDLCQPGVICHLTPDVLSLVREMEDRQRRWHANGTSKLMSRKFSHPPLAGSASVSTVTSPLSMSCSNSTVSSEPEVDIAEVRENFQERDVLCLRIVGAAKQVIEKMGFQPSEYPDGVEPL